MKTLIIVALVWFALGCAAQNDKLVWSDEFDGNGLPYPGKWGYDLGNSGFGNNEIQNYTNKTQNVRQENGVLIIEALKSGNSWTSARVVSRDKYQFTHGRVVFRAKLPAGVGTWSALWMLGANIAEASWPACGEIDVAEHRGIEQSIIYSSIHAPANYGEHVSTATHKVKSFDSEFHLYEANWKNDRVEFSIDNELFFTYKPDTLNSSTWPFDKPCYLIMNIAMGGNWASDPRFETNGLKNGIDPLLNSVRMEIDYVRIYEPD
jgi:beta-glucanase (GH16 family)